MHPTKKKKQQQPPQRDWSEDGTWDTAAPAAAEAREEPRRTVAVALGGQPEPAPAGASTTIGPSIVVRGRLISHEDLVVHGRIEASVRSSRDLRLEASGVILADLEVRSATIHGIVVGSIKATERIELDAGARVVGDIDTPCLVVHDGAKFRGAIQMPGLDGLERPKRPAAAAPEKPARASRSSARPAAAPVVAAVEWQDPEPEATPEPEPPPVVIPPSRPAPMQPATVATASAAGAASQPAQPARSRRPEPVGAEMPAAPVPAPSKRGWFSLG